MKDYTVVWVRSARDELARVWLETPDRVAVSDAARRIDEILCRHPSSKGTELSESLRSLSVPPLSALFAVRDDDRIVEVVAVCGT